MNIVDLSDTEVEVIEDSLSAFDEEFMTRLTGGRIAIGIKINDELVAGLEGCMTAFNIFYLSTLYVEEAHRRKGLGACLISEMEIRAKNMGVNTIRLDTFDFQGREFYSRMGYEQVGFYRNDEDGYEEYFFLKRI